MKPFEIANIQKSILFIIIFKVNFECIFGHRSKLQLIFYIITGTDKTDKYEKKKNNVCPLSNV